MGTRELYELWLKNATADEAVANELREIEGKEDEISDRFYRSLEFGTAGLRGVLGAGTNRMNIYTVGQATQGFADYINSQYSEPSVAIGYDSRINSDVFAKHAASVFAGNGIKVHIFSELEPTPVLSFAVRHLKCSAGVIVTASHNPAKYNGYKCYGSEGFQITDEAAGKAYNYIQKTDMFTGVKSVPFDEGLKNGMISYIDDEVLETFLRLVQSQTINEGVCGKSELSVVYTPLNGTGNKPVREIMRRIGVKNVTVVPEQENPDGNFPTCPYPNPEIRDTLTKALELAKKVSSDIILATDPDCDRVSVAVRDGDDYRIITGNEAGVLLLQYILSQRKEKGTLPAEPVALKSIVSSQLAQSVAEKYGCEMVDLLTGFKYIGEYVTELETKGELDRFVLGFEESCGYLVGAHARDKDAVVASMLICEMAGYYKLQGKTMVDVLNEIYGEHGMYLHNVLNFAFEGEEGMEKMKEIMDGLRENMPAQIGGNKVVMYADYQKSVLRYIDSDEEEPIKLPRSNVLSYKMPGGTGVIVRPSGTEPKIKIYITARGNSWDDSRAISNAIEADMKKLMGL